MTEEQQTTLKKIANDVASLHSHIIGLRRDQIAIAFMLLGVDASDESAIQESMSRFNTLVEYVQRKKNFT